MRALLSGAILAGTVARSAVALAPESGCSLPSELTGIPVAFDAAVSGPADKDRACMKALLVPEARIISISLGSDGTPSYTVLTLDDWIARAKARGHVVLEERQLSIELRHYGNIAHLWSSYALSRDGKQVARGINSIQAIKTAGGWRLIGIMFQAESATAPLPKEYPPLESGPGPAIGEPAIGRFGFFHSRFEETRWPTPLR